MTRSSTDATQVLVAAFQQCAKVVSVFLTFSGVLKESRKPKVELFVSIGSLELEKLGFTKYTLVFDERKVNQP